VNRPTAPFAAALAVLLLGCVDDPLESTTETHNIVSFNFGTYNLHLQNTLRFEEVEPGASAVQGRATFGLAADSDEEDKSQALFEGPSQEFGGVVVSNGRTCASCHRGFGNNLGLPPLPLSDTIPDDDALFTGIDADAGGDPDALHNLDDLGLIKYRPNRFDYVADENDAYRQVFFWRKVPYLVNTAFQHGFLSDGRGRVMHETDRGAVFSHTQSTDRRFGDLFTDQKARDLAAFQLEETLSDPRLAALLDPSDPMFETLALRPFYTVPVETAAQRRGLWVFVRNCMSCHNVPNVFNNLANVDPLGGVRTRANPAFAPSVGRTFDIGVAQRNAHNLRFTRYDGEDESFHDIVIPLANEDGSINHHRVTFDIGLAATTGRSADIGRFKVPQLRKIKDLGPYFHDNSVATLEEVIGYFNSDAYNQSRDGRRHPIDMTRHERRDLLQFLLIL
jgi:mono/diheme cytochrome c family protein